MVVRVDDQTIHLSVGLVGKNILTFPLIVYIFVWIVVLDGIYYEWLMVHAIEKSAWKQRNNKERRMEAYERMYNKQH